MVKNTNKHLEILHMQCPYNWIFTWIFHFYLDVWLHVKGASLVAQLVDNPSAMQETWVWSLGGEDPLEKGKATHYSILAWRIPWTVYSMGSQRVGHDWTTFTSLRTLLEEGWEHNECLHSTTGDVLIFRCTSSGPERTRYHFCLSKEKDNPWLTECTKQGC